MSQDTFLEFPCEFPLKIMGAADEEFKNEVVRLVTQFTPDFDPQTIETRPSRNGNYISLTCTIHATSKEQIDNTYLALTSHPLVKMML